MKKIFGLSLLIASAIAFAQEPAAVPAPAAEPAPAAVEPAAAPAVAEPVVAEEPVPAAPAEEAAPVAAAPVDTAAPAPVEAAPAETPVETAQKSEVPADTTPVVAPADTAQVAAVQDSSKASWSHFFGLGLSVPVAQYKAHGKKVDLINYALNFTYLGMADMGFSVKVDVSLGIASTDNIKFADSDDEWNLGGYTSAELGFGYTFGSAKGFMLSVLAVTGFEFADFLSEKNEYKHRELGLVDRNFEEMLFGITLGGDIIARYALSDNVGIFASVGGRWVAAVATASSITYDNNDDFIRNDTSTEVDDGNYSIVPTLGFMWIF